MTSTKTLVIILGPTGVGKTSMCLSIADSFRSPVISADSRQMYADIPIGTAAPTAQELERVKHYFVGNLKLDQYYSAAKYEEEAIALISELFKTHDVLVVAGGSMMYIDALCYGIDDIPTITPEVRQRIMSEYQEKGLEYMAELLHQKDPEYYDTVDRRNPKRVLHALEVCEMTGGTYTALRMHEPRKRPFNIVKIGLTLPREELYERINRRVDDMVRKGLVEEARRVMPYRSYNSLNTVGYKELFQYFDGALTPDGHPQTLEFAVGKIKQDSRIYSRKQMTWFKRDTAINWFAPSDTDGVTEYIKSKI